jgi:hypothetical protein
MLRYSYQIYESSAGPRRYAMPLYSVHTGELKGV